MGSHCCTCEYYARYWDSEYNVLEICDVEEPGEEDGFFIYHEVGSGDHVTCKLYKKKEE